MHLVTDVRIDTEIFAKPFQPNVSSLLPTVLLNDLTPFICPTILINSLGKFNLVLMKNFMSKKNKRFGWVLLAVILLAFPIYVMVTRIASWKVSLSQAENVIRYLQHFPGFLQSSASITWTALVLNITANVLTIGTSFNKKTTTRWLSMLLVIIGVLLMLWLGFTLL
jgi:hypothetical protein